MPEGPAVLATVASSIVRTTCTKYYESTNHTDESHIQNIDSFDSILLKWTRDYFKTKIKSTDREYEIVILFYGLSCHYSGRNISRMNKSAVV